MGKTITARAWREAHSLRFCECAVEPSSREFPHALGRDGRDAQGLGGFVEREPAERPQLDEPREFRVDGFELLQGEIEIEKRVDRERAVVGGQGTRLVDARTVASSFGGAPPARVVDEYTPHRAGRHGEEAQPRVDTLEGVTVQSQIGLVDEGRGLQRVPRRFVSKMALGRPPQVLVDRRPACLVCIRRSRCESAEQVGDVVMGRQREGRVAGAGCARRKKIRIRRYESEAVYARGLWATMRGRSNPNSACTVLHFFVSESGGRSCVSSEPARQPPSRSFRRHSDVPSSVRPSGPRDRSVDVRRRAGAIRQPEDRPRRAGRWEN